MHDLQELHYVSIQTLIIITSDFLVVKTLGSLFLESFLMFAIFELKFELEFDDAFWRKQTV